MMRIISALLIALFSLISFTASAIDSNYVLGKDDVIRVTVYDHPDMTTEAQINDEGFLSFPLIGKIKVVGQTGSGVEALISNALKSGGYIKNPNVNVAVVAYKSQKISILGDVFKPGLYTLDGGTSLQQALATAGGISPAGGERLVLIRGKIPAEYRLSDYLTSGATILVQADDVIFVPHAEQVYIYGEVNRPGVYRLENGMTATQLVAMAGGFTQRADDDDLKLTRVSNGKSQLYRVSASDLIKASDIIHVGESLF